MAKFIELTLQHNDKGLLINIDRLQYVENSDITADDSNFYSVKESYEEIKAKILTALGEKTVNAPAEDSAEKVLEKLKAESDCICKENEELALELDKLKAEATRKEKNIEWEKSVFHKTILKYGVSSQVGVAMEEMGELIQALSKSMRNKPNNVSEEIADVEIMLEQLKLIFDCEDRVKDIRKEKVKRLEGRIAEEREGERK